MNATETISRMN